MRWLVFIQVSKIRAWWRTLASKSRGNFQTMTIVAYLANQFPSAVELYVVDEIRELRRRGVTVIPCSARSTNPGSQDTFKTFQAETLYLQPLGIGLGLRAAWLCLRRFGLLWGFLTRMLFKGNEPPARRLRALLHTWLGACYALRIKELGVEHIHVHHGYFGSWIAMVTARLLGIRFSMTLHGSDLLLHPAWLDVKLNNCEFCLTISDFNRRHILERHPGINPAKLIVQRLGVAPCEDRVTFTESTPRFTMLAVGRLHPVKNHTFLLRACAELKFRGIEFTCMIAGEGPERANLERLIWDLDLSGRVHLLGQLSQEQLDVCYRAVDLVVLTSHSEGIPLALMEAMVRRKLVLAPRITGIPELVIDGQTGFLYPPGSCDGFVSRVELIRVSQESLSLVCEAARAHVLEHFDRGKNLARFSDLFLSYIGHQPNAHPANASTMEARSHANPLLQQI